MKQHVLGSLTAAFVVTAFGAPLPGQAQVDGSDLSSQQESADAPDPNGEEPHQTAALDDATDSPPSDSNPEPTETADNSNFSIYPHPLDERQAATLYVQSIPVLTFVGPQLASLSGDKSLEAEVDEGAIAQADAPADPLSRARQVEELLQEFRRNSGDPESIVARWDSDEEKYVVALDDRPLVTLGSSTMLPDTTQEPGEDALHVANRLRRLMGGAAPLEEVVGRPEPPQPPQLAVRSATTGMASWYGPGFHGRRSASGEIFNQNALTAAHRTLPFGTQVRVTNLHTQQQVIVRINDRGPFSHNRVIDLSAAAARAIGLHVSGVGPVRVEVLASP